MADELAPVPTFDSALAELVAELAKTNPVAAKRVLEKATVGAGAYGLPSMPEIPRNALGAGELRSSLSPEVDVLMGATGLPTAVGGPLDLAYRIGSAGPRQMQTADAAIGRAVADPTLGNVANAGTQTGMAILSPRVAIPSAAVQYGNALVEDLGLLDTSAQAQAPLKKSQQREMEMERQRREGEAAVERQRMEAASKLKREEAAEADRLRLETEAKAADRAEYNAAVTRANEMRQAELDKRRTFRDTAVGKVYDETGGAAPFFLGALSGLVQRGVKPDVSQARLIGWGAGGGAAASNLPTFADAYIVPPVENPDQRAMSVYARELPPTHPRKQEMLQYAENEKLLPKLNPARATAKDEFTDTIPAIKRNIGGAIEGAVGAEMGMGAWAIPARYFNALGRGAGGFLQGLERRLTPQSRPQIPASGAMDDVAQPAAGRNALAGPEPTPQRQLPSPEASANQPAPQPRVVVKSRGKDGVTRHHDERGHFTGNPRKSVDE